MTIAKLIDQSLLKPTLTSHDIDERCEEAIEYDFFAVCVNPVYVRQAVRALSASEVAVATVVGFPLGANLTDIKIAEAQRAIFEGVEEIDMVLNIGALKEGNLSLVTSEIESIVKAAKGHPIKVIVETSRLTDEEKVKAVKACISAGAFMVKTCTGFLKDCGGAKLEDIKLFKDTIGDAPLKIKASAGISSYEKAKAMIDAGASRIGTSSGVQIVQESRNLTAVH